MVWQKGQIALYTWGELLDAEKELKLDLDKVEQGIITDTDEIETLYNRRQLITDKKISTLDKEYGERLDKINTVLNNKYTSDQVKERLTGQKEKLIKDLKERKESTINLGKIDSKKETKKEVKKEDIKTIDVTKKDLKDKDKDGVPDYINKLTKEETSDIELPEMEEDSKKQKGPETTGDPLPEDPNKNMTPETGESKGESKLDKISMELPTKLMGETLPYKVFSDELNIRWHRNSRDKVDALILESGTKLEGKKGSEQRNIGIANAITTMKTKYPDQYNQFRKQVGGTLKEEQNDPSAFN